LSPFEAEQQNVFFGRNTDIKELSKLIFVERMVLLYSKSGYGKTSLLNAGVKPELKKNENFEFIDIRFTAWNEKNQPLKPDKAFLQGVSQNADFKASANKETLIDTYASDYLGEYWSVFKKNQLLGNTEKTYVLVFDQFEELFTYPDEQIEVFKSRLSDLFLESRMPAFIKNFEKQLFANRSKLGKDDMAIFYQPINIKAVFAIRSDRLSELNNLADKLPDIQKVFYELQALSNQQVREAIEKPARQEGEFDSRPFAYENTAIDKIVNALTNNGKQKIETTQLQIVCHRIEENSISRADLPDLKNPEDLTITATDIPDFRDIFLNFYNDAVAKVKSDNIEAVHKFIEDQLIIEGRRISLDQYVCQRHVQAETLETLIKTRLLRAERNSVEGFSYELSHDTLVPPIKEMADKRRLKEEEERQRAKQRRQIRIISLSILVSLVSISAAIFGFVMWQKAEIQTEKAKKGELKIKEATTNYYLRDARAYIDKKEYEVARQKYKYLVDSIMGGVSTPAVDKRIKECDSLISSQKLFLDFIDMADKAFENKDFEQTLEYYTKAMRTKMDNADVKSRLKDLQKIVDENAGENRKLEKALSYSPTAVAKYRTEAKKYEDISKTITELINNN